MNYLDVSPTFSVSLSCYYLFYLIFSPSFHFAVVQSLNCVDSLRAPWTAAYQSSLSLTISQSLLKLMSIESVMPSSHLILSHPLLLLPSVFPNIGVFSNNLALHIRWPSTAASASAAVLPMNIRTWFPWGLTRLISLQSKGLYGSAPQFKSIHSLALSLLYGPSFSVHDCWKNHSFDNAYRPLSAKWCFIMCCLGLS